MQLNFAVEREFLHAIAQEPNEDAHRLVYADWLEEQGDARGELVRVQVQLARLGEFGEPRLQHPLQIRQEELWVHLRPIREHFHRMGVTNFEFRRGVLEGICVQGKPFVEHAGSIFRDAPAITELDLIRANDLFEEISTVPEFQNVRSLRIGGRLEEEQLLGFNRLVLNSNIDEIELSYFWAPETFGIFQSIGHRLKKLVVDSSTFSDSGRIDSTLTLPEVTCLRIPGCQMSTAALGRLLKTINAKKLIELDIQHISCDQEIECRIVEEFTALQKLSIDSDDIIGEMSNASLLQSLVQLRLTHENQTRWQEIFKLPFQRLRHFELRLPSSVKSAQVKIVLNSDLLLGLYHLRLRGGNIPRHDFDVLCDALTQVPGWETGSKRTLITDVGRRVF